VIGNRIFHNPDNNYPVIIDRVIEQKRGKQKNMIVLKEKGNWNCEYRLEKSLGCPSVYGSDLGSKTFLEIVKPYEVVEGEDNCLLNTGIDELWDLVTGAVS
jgi:hypothetical protein